MKLFHRRDKEKSRSKNSVRSRIFRSNALMTATTAIGCIVINIILVKIFWELVEHRVHHYFEHFHSRMDGGELISWILYHYQPWVLLFAAMDLALCILLLVLVSRWFTNRLACRIMEPLQILQEGARKIQNNDYTEDISYTGDLEFETVCDSFNSMRRHLQEEKEKNERYEKARQGMIAGISHDLRTPLTAAHGMIKGVLDKVASTPEQQKKFLTAAYRRTDEMSVMLSQLFYLSTLETKGVPMHLCTLDLEEFLRNFISSRKEMPEMEKIVFHLEVDPSDSPYLAQADPEQLLRIFENLLSNSRKYAESDPLEITISMEHAGEGRQRIIFADNGVGVPENKLNQIFEEFYRVDESRNRKEGNGIGLYVVRYLMTAMNGSVYARNDNGFQVILLLPQVRKESAAELPAPEGADEAAAQPETEKEAGRMEASKEENGCG